LNNKKSITSNINWWLDLNILSSTNMLFKYSKSNNNYILKIESKFLYYFFLLNKSNLNTLNFYILDLTSFLNINNYNYFVIYQSIFYDYQILVETQFFNSVDSLSSIYNGSLWLEREVKEFNKIMYNNLLDSRKLLSNYNYNCNLEYNNYNNILNELKF